MTTAYLDTRPRSLPELRADTLERINEYWAMDRRGCALIWLFDRIAMVDEHMREWRG